MPLIEKSPVTVWLKGAGIPCMDGQYPFGIPTLSSIMAVVRLKKMEEGKTVYSVSVVSPMEIGYDQCVYYALKAYQTLRKKHCRCTLHACGFHAGQSCFLQEITAEIPESLDIVIRIDEKQLSNVRRFRAAQETVKDPDNPGTLLAGRWNFEIRQLGHTITEGLLASFTMQVTAEDDSTVTYTDCRWTEFSVEKTPDGYEVIRKGSAAGRTVA